jgi:hypothetical protein
LPEPLDPGPRTLGVESSNSFAHPPVRQNINSSANSSHVLWFFVLCTLPSKYDHNPKLLQYTLSHVSHLYIVEPLPDSLWLPEQHPPLLNQREAEREVALPVDQLHFFNLKEQERKKDGQRQFHDEIDDGRYRVSKYVQNIRCTKRMCSYQREHIGIERRLRQLPLCLPVQYSTTNAGHQLVAPGFFFIFLSERKFHLEQHSRPSIFPKNA